MNPMRSIQKRQVKRGVNNKTLYFVKQGFLNIVSHKIMSAASICIVAAALALIGLFTAVGININELMQRIGSSYEINVYLNSENERSISDIEGELKRIPGVKSVSFYSREDRLEKVSREVYGDDGYVFKDGENPLRDSFIITVNNLTESDDISKAAENIDGVDEVIRSKDIIGGIDTATRAVRNIGIWIMAVLVILAVFIVYNTIRLGMSSFENEIGIMRIVGASETFIIGPFVVQGFALGVTGAALADILILIGYKIAESNISALISGSITELAGIGMIAAVLTPILMATGGLIGIIGSLAAALRDK